MFINVFLNFRENSEKLVQGVYIWGSDEFKRLFLPALAFDRVSFRIRELVYFVGT